MCGVGLVSFVRTGAGETRANCRGRDRQGPIGFIFDELMAFIEDNPAFDDECNIKRHEKVIEHLPCWFEVSGVVQRREKSARTLTVCCDSR